MIDAYASEPHFAEHLAAVWPALPPRHRGAFMVRDERTAAAAIARGITPADVEKRDGAALVAATGDLRHVRSLGRTQVALMEHGAGQSYAGSRTNSRHGAYAGGTHRDASLFLHPGPHPAARDRAAYPDAAVEIVGSPILDELPARLPGPGPVVAFAFHFEATIVPETRPAFAWIRDELARQAELRPVLGHGHPRIIDRLAPWYMKRGIRVAWSFADVCRGADVLVADNTSALFAFAATGRPVVVLNPPWYRRNVNHGLRFWDAASVGVNVDEPADLGAAIDAAIADGPELAAAREAALDLVYAYRTGAPQRAADALVRWVS